MNILKVNQPKNRPKIEMFGIKKPLTHCKSGVKKFIYVVPLGQLNHFTSEISTLHKQTKNLNKYKD